ncbi:MAG: hypothetical protein HY243_12180 [Proteobacteria bacterium]|nr:hypothetical protein [Pseudomonadota bacterium]
MSFWRGHNGHAPAAGDNQTDYDNGKRTRDGTRKILEGINPRKSSGDSGSGGKYFGVRRGDSKWGFFEYVGLIIFAGIIWAFLKSYYHL